MPDEVRIWEVREGGDLSEVKKAQLELEERIEGWLEKDISIIQGDLLVIGRQVNTDFGGAVDLLCLDSLGNLTIVELKRDKTPREVTAQVLEYASWVRDLTAPEIEEIANKYLGEEGPLGRAFTRKFGKDLPESLGAGEESMLVVASRMDYRSERIVRYLSDVYGVRINVATFNYFRNEEGKELLARIFLLEPGQVEYKSQSKAPSKMRPTPTVEELCERADRHGSGKEFRIILEAAQKHSLYPRPYTNSVTYGPPASRGHSLFSVALGGEPGESATIKVFHGTWPDFFAVTEEQVSRTLGFDSRIEHHLTLAEAEAFVRNLDQLFASIGEEAMPSTA